MMVLEELDNNKKGHSEVARNARQVSRFLDEIIADASAEKIAQGLELPHAFRNGNNNQTKDISGKLYLQTEQYENNLPTYLPGQSPDNNILNTVLGLCEAFPDQRITLVSKDINLRIKAAVLGLHSEDYHNDKVLEDVDLLHTGVIELDETFWDKHAKEMDSWIEKGRTYYRIHGPDVQEWSPNSFLVNQSTIAEHNNFEAMVREINDDDSALIEMLRDYAKPTNAVWGINARNREQNMALNLLMDPEIDFITLLGTAGTGKTLLTLAAGLAQTLDMGIYNEIIMTRVTVPLGDDIGFLPGTEEEKMTPWMGALMDNLEVLTQGNHSSDWARAATNDLLSTRIKIRSVNFMRGRTFLNRYIIIDEAQNLSSKQLKSLITRAGPGTKVICLGNIAQIDTPYLTETTSGLTYIVDRFKNWQHSGHITLRRGERSRLADYASEML